MSDHPTVESALANIITKVSHWMDSPAAEQLERRLALLANAVFIPDAGMGDSNAVAFFMNLREEGAAAQLAKNNVPGVQPGARKLYRFKAVAAGRKGGKS